MKQQCTVDLNKVFAYVNALVKADARFKNFDEVAKDMINRRQDRPDDVKLVALKAIAKIYEHITTKQPGLGYEMGKGSALLLSTELQSADLDTVFGKLKSTYAVKTPGAPRGVQQIAERVDKADTLNDLELVTLIKDITTAINALLKRIPSAAIMTAKNSLLYEVARLNRIVTAGTNVADQTKKVVLGQLAKLTDKLRQISAYVPLSTTRYGQTYRIYDKDNNLELQVYLNSEDQKYYRVDNPTEVVDVNGKKLIPVVYDRPGINNVEVTQDGEFRILRYAEMISGMQLRGDVAPEAKERLLLSENPNDIMEVEVSMTPAQQNQQRLDRIREQVPQRTLETFESYEQQLFMKQQGKPVAAVSSAVAGIAIYITVPGVSGKMPVYDLSNYAIVYPDNTTVPVDFTNKDQWDLIRSVFKKTDKNKHAVPLTDYDLQQLSDMQSKVNAFKEKAEAFLKASGKSSVKLPREMFKDIISVAKGGMSVKGTLVKDSAEGATLEDALKLPSNQRFMVEVPVVTVDENGVAGQPVMKNVPLLIRREKGTRFVFASGILPDGEFAMDDDGTPTTIDAYFQKKYPEALNVAGINPLFPKHISFAIVARDTNGAMTVVGMNKMHGADPVRNMLKFASTLVHLKKELLANPGEANRIMNRINRELYFLSPDNGWVADLSAYVDRTKKTVSYNYEIRHMNDKSFTAYAQDDEQVRKLKAASRIYFGIDPVEDIDKMLKKVLDTVAFKNFLARRYPTFTSMEDLLAEDGTPNSVYFDIIFEYIDSNPELSEELYATYDKITNSMKNNLVKAQEKFAELGYPLGAPRVYVMLENEKSNLTGRWFLKVNDKSVDLNAQNFDQFRLVTGEELLKSTNLFMQAPGTTTLIPAAAEVVGAESMNVPVTSQSIFMGGSKPPEASTDYEISEDEDAPFSLAEENEAVVVYDNQSWKSELAWLEANLPADFSVEDLAKIKDDLRHDGRLLGYYKNMVIYLNKEMSGKGTGYHEAFHGVFRALLNDTERNFYTAKALAQMPAITQDQIEAFREKRKLYHLSDNTVKQRMAEEYMADQFKAYKLDKKEPSQPWLRYLVRLLDKLFNFFTGKAKQIDDITALFNRIDSGYYKNARVLNQIKEGAAELLPSRPVVVGESAEGKPVVKRNNFNTYNQNQLVNRLAFEVSMAPGANFNEKYAFAVNQLLNEYNIDKLIAANPQADAQKIRDKYQDLYADIRFALGDVASMTQNVTGNQALTRQIKEEDIIGAANLLKSQVRETGKKIDVKNLMFDPEATLEEMDDEDQHVADNYSDSFGNLNSLDGLSRQFRRLFALLPYSYTDKDTGVKVTKMVDGAKVYDAIMKISADVPFDMLLENLETTIESLKEEGQLDAYEKLSTVFGTLRNLFELNESYQPTRNINLYNQFMNTFFVTEVPTLVYHLKTTENYGTRGSVYDATIQRDIAREIERLKVSYTKEYYRNSPEQRKKIFDAASKVLFDEVVKSTNLNTEVGSMLEKKATAVKAALDSMGLHFSKSLIKFSLVSIDRENNPQKVFNPNSTAAKILKANPLLVNQGAYLQKDFFSWISGSVLGSSVNIFERADFDEALSEEDAEEQDVIRQQRTPQQNTQLKGVNSILKKAAAFMVKYNVDAAVSVFKNAEGKNVYRYVKYTPFLLLSQAIKHGGVSALIDEYPFMEEWFNDNPALNNKSKELELYLANLTPSMLGGSRQTIMQKERDGYTFKKMDPRTKHLVDLVMFGKRDVIRKNNTEIIVYNRSYNILEGTSTNFLIPAMYRSLYDKDGYIKDESGQTLVIKDVLSQIGQEYNRIQREWASREQDKPRFIDYNGRVTTDPQGNRSVDTSSDSLRGYHFNRLAKFFGKNDSKITTYVHPDPEVTSRRNSLGEQLRELAKANIPFKQIMTKPEYEELREALNSELANYMEEEYQAFEDSLLNYNLIEKTTAGELTAVSSELIPQYIKTGERTPEDLASKNLSLKSYLRDYFFNDYTSKLMYNQLFDGDMAVTVKNGTMLGMRNKSSVISGDSMRDGFHRVAYIDKIKVWLNANDIADGQYDTYEEIPEELLNKPGAKWIQKDAADGQSYTSLEHRIYMYGKQGRLEESNDTDGDDMDTKSILEKARIEPLSNEEIKFLEKKRIVLGSYKTATGGLIDFIKQSEHILLRSDISYIETGDGVTREEVINDFLKPLYKEADVVRQYLINGQGHVLIPGYNKTAAEVLREIYENIHAYYKPLPGRVTLHNMLNSMEIHGIDQLFDLNASKKASLLSVKLNNNGYTDLSTASRAIPNKYKFMQVETSGVSRKITMPSQKRQLIDTDILLDNPNVPAELKESVKNYRKVLADTGSYSYEMIQMILDAPDNEVNLVPIVNAMREGLQNQGADANILKYFELDENGKPRYNMNLPMRKVLFQNYFFALYSNTVFGEKSSGRKDFEVSGFGYKLVVDENDNIIPQEEVKKNPTKYANYTTRYPGVKRTVGADGIVRYVVEVIIPKPLFKSKKHEELFLARLTEMISTRIPTEDKRSMVVAKAVDYTDGAYQNIVILPQLVHELAGSDLDIDALYSQTLATYEDFLGNPHVYGEYDTYDIPVEQAKFVEYLVSKSEDDVLEADIETELKRILGDDNAIDEIPEALLTLAETLGIPAELGISKENMKQRLIELKELRQDYYTKFLSLKEQRQQIYDEYVKLRSQNEALFEEVRQQVEAEMSKDGLSETEFYEKVVLATKWRIHSERLAGRTEGLPDWRKQSNYSQNLRSIQFITEVTAKNLGSTATDYKEQRATVKDTFDKLDRQFRLIATLNVLARYNMPTTIEKYARSRKPYIKENIQNRNVKAQIAILSHPYVYENLWKNERSDTSFYGKLIESLDSSIDSVVDKYDINSPAWIANVLLLNASSDDGIGISASNNKFLAFATKKSLRLAQPIWNINGTSYDEYKSFVKQGEDDVVRVIKKVGGAIGMFADAKKEPYPSIINLDPDTTSISMGMVGIGIPEEAAYMINMIPLIDKVIKLKQSATSNTVSQSELFKKSNLISIADEQLGQEYARLKQENRLGELFALKNGKVAYDNNGNPVVRKIEISFSFDATPSKRSTAEGFGFTAVYKGTDDKVPDDIVQIHLLGKYQQQAELNADTLHVVNILNLIKKLKPDFATLDKIIYSYNFLMGRLYKKPAFSNISRILNESEEYKPLIASIVHMYGTAEKVFLERNPVFKVINENLDKSMFTFSMGDNMRNALNAHVVKYMLVNKFKSRIEKALTEERGKKTPNQKFINTYEQILGMYSADFWTGKSTDSISGMDEDMKYLYEAYPDNPFVQFLKYRSKQGVTLVEALSRMKLDSETSDQIIDGYNLLRSSIDEQTKLIANKLYWYVLVKDNLGMGNNSFINYLNPEVYESVSRDLDELQKILNKMITGKVDRRNFFNGKSLSDYFNKASLDIPSLMSTIAYKAMTHVNNNEYVPASRRFSMGSNRGALGSLDSVKLGLFLQATIPSAMKNSYMKLYGLEENDDNKKMMDLLVPDSLTVDQGSVELDFSELTPTESYDSNIQNTVFRSLRVGPEYKFNQASGKEEFAGWSFPMVLKNSKGTLFRLDTIDGKAVGEYITENIASRLENGMKDDYVIAGKIARYVVTQPEGTHEISNNAFSTEDARMLNSFTVASRTYSDLTATQEFNDFLGRMLKDFRVPVQSLENLKKWVKKDVDVYGMIKFGKNGVYTLKYSVPNEDPYKADYQYQIELSPASNGDGLSLKATQYLLIDSLKTELYSKEFKAVEYHTLSKEERIAKRQAEREAQANNATAALLGMSVEDAIAKGFIADPTKKDEELEQTMATPQQQESYEKALKEADEIMTEEQFQTFMTNRIMDTKHPDNLARVLPDELFNAVGTYLEKIAEEVYSGKRKPKVPAAPPAPVIKPFTWKIKSTNGFEVSSKGTALGREFSALYAKLKDGRSVEEIYQLDVKGYRKSLNEWLAAGNRFYSYKGKEYDLVSKPEMRWIYGKGKPPLIEMTVEKSYEMYKSIWKRFAVENPLLMKSLIKEAAGKDLTDQFAASDTGITQARALADIINDMLANPGESSQIIDRELEQTIINLQNKCK